MRYFLLLFMFISCVVTLAQHIEKQTKTQNYYQTFKQVVDSTYYYNWNVDALSWEMSQKDAMVYDTMGILKMRTSFMIDETKSFTQTEQLINTIVDHEIVGSQYANFDGLQFIPDFKTINAALVDSSFTYNDVDKVFELFAYLDYTMNEMEKPVQSIHYKRDDNDEIGNYLKTEYTYSSSENTELVSKWDSISESWFYSTKYMQSLNESSQIDTFLVQIYDTVASLWENDHRIIYSYNEQLVMESIMQFYESGNWINQTKDSIAYTEENLESQHLRMIWDAGEERFMNFSRNAYHYNYLGNRDEDTFQLWHAETGTWINVKKSVHYYSSIVCNLDVELSIVNDISCYGASDGEIQLEINGGNAPYEISWQNLDGTALIQEALEPNVYYPVVVRDANLCETIDSIALTEPDSLHIEVSLEKEISCAGYQDGMLRVLASGGTGEYTYLWNDELNSTTDSLANVSAGDYVVTVTDEKNCIAVHEFEVAEPLILQVNVLDSAHISCFGEEDGFIQIAASQGTPPYAYVWPNIELNDSVAENLQANYYHFIVTDANGCQIVDSVQLLQPERIETSDIAGLNSVDVNDAVEYTVEQTPGSFYHWEAYLGLVKYGNGTNLVLVEWDTVGDGLVRVIEEDANGCFGDTVNYSVTVQQGTGIVQKENEKIHVYPNPFSEILHVQMDVKIPVKAYQLVDLSGQIALQKKNINTTSFRIDGSALESGVYFLYIHANKVYVKKVIVE